MRVVCSFEEFKKLVRSIQDKKFLKSSNTYYATITLEEDGYIYVMSDNCAFRIKECLVFDLNMVKTMETGKRYSVFDYAERLKEIPFENDAYRAEHKRRIGHTKRVFDDAKTKGVAITIKDYGKNISFLSAIVTVELFKRNILKGGKLKYIFADKVLNHIMDINELLGCHETFLSQSEYSLSINNCSFDCYDFVGMPCVM